MVHGFDSISITQFPAMICSVSVEGFLNRVAHSIQIFLLLILSKSFLFNLCAFDACLPLSSAQSYLVRFQLLAQSHDIGKQNFVSLHSGFIIIDFDEAASMQCWHVSLICTVGITLCRFGSHFPLFVFGSSSQFSIHQNSV